MSRTAKLAAFGVATFFLCAIVFAPASLIRSALPVDSPVTLASPTGTLWRGSGEVGVAGTPLGRIDWTFAPAELLNGALGCDVSLDGTGIALAGRAASTFRSARATLTGSIDMSALADTLARYDIRVPGRIAIERLEVSGPHGARLPQTRGELRWSGGDVDYRLSGHEHHVTLPPLVGFVDSSSGQPEISVYQVDDKMPLLLARITQDGVASIGITKGFTKMLGEPWPGSEPDHAVVLEVGEKLF